MTKSDVIGVWQLEKFEVASSSGLSSWGENLRGLLFYTEDGFVSVAINRNLGQPHFNAANDSLFYAGTFEILGNQIVHQIQLATNAQRIESEMIRNAELISGKLILSGNSESGKPFSLLWKKV